MTAQDATTQDAAAQDAETGGGVLERLGGRGWALAACFFAALAVAFLATFAVAWAAHGLSGQPARAETPQPGASAQAGQPQPDGADGGSPEGGEPESASGQETPSSSAVATAANAATSAPDPAALAKRDADFAVDPARTDWNYATNGRKTVYLTIDDGPSEKTQAVLDILDRYGCKATFFVVGHNDDYFPMIAEAYRRGHTIGLHTYTHDYAQVYSSADAFFADLDAIGEVVRQQIGYVPCFIRFPGGSSNDISADFHEGIMTDLVGEVQARGYQYYDWNLSVGDGAEHTTDEIAEYGTADEGDENIMLLCHDSMTKDATVEALPRIIEHYQSLGYTFEAIDRDSWVCHHDVVN